MRSVFADEFYPYDLSALPHGWSAAWVEDIVLDIRPGFASGIHNNKGVGVVHLRPMNISRDGLISLNDVKYVAPTKPLRIRSGDVLFNNTNSPELVGKTAAIDQDRELAFSNHMTRLQLPDGVRPKFVALQLHSLWMQGYFARRCVNHVNQASVASRTLAETVPMMIAPSVEQDRIVAEIEKHFTRLDAAVAALERAQVNLKRYRATVLKAACEGHLVPTEAELARAQGREYEPAGVVLVRILAERRARWEADQLARMEASGKSAKDEKWKAKYVEPESPKADDRRLLPDGWIWTTVEQLESGDRICGYGVLQPGPNIDDGVPLVRVGDIDNGRINAATLKRIDPSIARQYRRTCLRGGEVLITLVGAIGRTALVPATLSGSNTARAVGVIPVSGVVSARWVELWLRNPERIAEMTAKSHEVARKTLNLEDVRSTIIALPPRPEQERIRLAVEERLSVVDDLDSLLDRSLARAKRLRHAILNLAFEGRLVKQDLNDEPASELLGRIRTERTRSGGSSSGNAPSALASPVLLEETRP